MKEHRISLNGHHVDNFDGEGSRHTEDRKNLRQRISNRLSNSSGRKRAIKKFVRKKLPITKWLPKYNRTSLYYDLIAGITVGLMLVPQSLAYSALAGLSPEYGLYASYCGVFIYFIFGTSKDLQTGPAALVAMLVNRYTLDGEHKVIYATSLSLFSGIVLILMSVFRLQFLINFISIPVLAGFTSAAAIKIGVSQLKGMFGLSLHRDHFFHTVYNNFANIKQARIADSVLGFTCLVVFVVLRKVGRWNSERRVNSSSAAVCKKILWFICTARFTLAVLITTISSQILYECFGLTDVFMLAGEMTSGVPPPKVPISDLMSNGTIVSSKLSIIQHLGIGCVVTPFVAFLETIAVAKTLSRKSNYKIDVTQELFSLGIVNVIGSFFSAFPVAGSFSRSALNSQCSVRTQLGGFFTGIIVLLAASFLTPWFKYIPKATLSAMIIAAVIPLFEYHIVPLLWKTKKIDLVTMAVTFLLCFYETELGILAGVVVALCIFVYETIQLKLSQERTDSNVVLEVGSQGIHYPSAEQLIAKLDKIINSKKFKPNAVILDLKQVTTIDSTAAAALKQFWLALRTGEISGPKMVFRNVQGRPRIVLEKIGITFDEEIEVNMTSFRETGSCSENHEMDSNLHGRLYPKLDEEV